MLRRSNKRKNKSDKSIEKRPADSFYAENDVPAGGAPAKAEERAYEDTMSREEFIKHNEDARKVYEDIMKLRASIDNLKQTGVDEVPEEIEQAQETIQLKETEDIIAAKQAIIQQARRDALEEKQRRVELARKEYEKRLQEQKALEAQRRAALIEEEAERKRKQAEEAEKQAKEVARKAALEAMEAKRKSAEEQILPAAEAKEEAKDEPKTQTVPETDLEDAKKALLMAQEAQDVKLNMISWAAEKHTNKLAEEQQEKLAQQQEKIKSEQEHVEAILEEQKEQRIERLTEEARAKEIRRLKALEEKRLKEEQLRALKAEKLAKAQVLKAEKEARQQAERAAKLEKAQAEKEAKIARQLAEREAKQAKLLAEREAKRIKEEKRRLEKIRKAEEKELIKLARKDPDARARLEKMMMEAKSQADAELGGGIVNVQGMTITTEIKEVAHISWRDLFNIRTKRERQAESESEKKKLARERRRRTERARQIADTSLKQKRIEFERTQFAQRMKKFYAFCDNNKTRLLVVFAIVLTVAVAAAGVFNHYSAYAYSYNGRELGVVKEKDDVLQITDLVQGALTEDKNVDVIIDARKDISFHRVWTTSDVPIDTSEDVLKRLTYMGDLNVKAYGIFVDNKRVGVVEDKAVAEEVFRDIEEKYKSGMEDAEIKSIEIIEKWEGKKCNASLEDVLTEKEMVSALSSSVKSESLHEIAVGETLTDIAKLYSVEEEDILAKNPNIDKRKLVVGSKIVIEKEAPVLTVKITEDVSYEKVIEHKVEKKDSKEIYEGYTETKQKGSDGLSEITSTITLVNGKQIDEKVHNTVVKKAPVTEVILIGIKERPPSVGSGKYIWPFKSGYTLTSGFKWRWGRLHEGIDLGTPSGNDVLAADGGIVTFAGYSGGYGYLIKIDHQNGMETRYAHNSKLLVSEGDKVFQGMHIAESGNSGRSTGPHLHFEIRVNGTPKDPLSFLP